MKCGRAIFLVLAMAGLASAQTVASGPVDVNALVRRAIQLRLEESKDHRPVRYVLHQADGRRDTTKDVIETKDGDVDRVVAIDGKPLDAEQEQAQIARLDNFANDPEQQEQRHRNEQKTQARMDHLASLVPDAFVYKLEGTVTCATGECYKLSFTPNPKWSPPDFQSRLFQGVAGEVWIDVTQDRLERLDAHFIANVDFGFGILGRVNKGGEVQVEQRDIGGNQWQVTSLRVNLAGRLLLVKPFTRQFSEEATQIVPVAPMGYREAIELLKKGGAGGAAGEK